MDGTDSAVKFLSLGYDCRAGFQICRYFGKQRCLPSIFDRQITPPQALYEYLQRDFRGMFEAGDVKRAGGYLYNMRYGTRYSHEVEDAFNASYEAGFTAHERLCDATREALSGDTPLTFVIHAMASFELPNELDGVLARWFPRLNFKTVVLRDEGQQTHGQAEWRGNNAVWDEQLALLGPPQEKRPTFPQWERLKRHLRRRHF